MPRKNKSGTAGGTPIVPLKITPAIWARFCELVAEGKRTAKVEALIKEFNLRNA